MNSTPDPSRDRKQIEARIAVLAAVRHLVNGDVEAFDRLLPEFVWHPATLCEAMLQSTAVLARVEGGMAVLNGLTVRALDQLGESVQLGDPA